MKDRGKFLCTRFNCNAGENFTAYYRIYTVDGHRIRLERANTLSHYGMKKLPHWTIVENDSPHTDNEIRDILAEKKGIIF